MNNANLTNFKNATIDNLIAKYANITDLKIMAGDTLVAEFVNGDCRINNNLLIYGDLIVNGEHYDIDTAHLRIADNLFKIASENITSHIDIGYYAPFSNKFIGWIHDKDSSRWKPFKDVPNTETMTLTVPRPLILGDIEAGSMYATEFYASGSASSSQISGLNAALSTHLGATNNPHSVTRSQLGLGVTDAVTFDDLRTNSIKSTATLNIKKASDSITLLSLTQDGNLDVLGTVEGRNLVTDGGNLDTLVSRVNQAVKIDSSPTFQKIVINEGMEIYNALSKPFIDFHEAKDSTADSAADYKYRIQSESDSLRILRVGDALKLGVGQNTSAFFTKLGVGLSPTYSLDIKSNDANDAIRFKGAADNLQIILNNESGTTGERAFSITNNLGVKGLMFQAYGNSDDFNRTIMTMMHSGKVGIGTNSPDQTLHVKSSAAASNYIKIEHTDNAYQTAIQFQKPLFYWSAYVPGSSTDFRFYYSVGNVDIMTLQANGNVGIDITPTEKLHVNGNIKSTGVVSGTSLNVGTGSITSGAITSTGAISGASLNVGTGSITSGAISGTSLNVGTGAIYCGDIEATTDITAKQYLFSTHTTTPSLFLNNESAVGGGLSGMRQYWDFSASKMRVDGVNYLNTALYTDVLTLDYLGKLACKDLVVSGLTANKYLKTDADKKIVSTDITTDVRAQFSAGSGIAISSGVISTLNGSYYPTVDNITFETGTGSIDSYLHFYNRNSTFCDVSGQIEVFPNSTSSQRVSFDVTLPVNHNAQLSESNIIAQGGSAGYAWRTVARSEISLTSGVYNKFKITLYHDSGYNDYLINLRYSYKV